MRFLRVVASAFGPLHREELEFGSGLNIVVGPNEARKSSWHGAMYAGLCGRRRAKGRAPADDQAFERRHRPWHGDEWTVRAEIALDDGRTIELRHNLDARRSEVVDLEFGRPIEDDIVFEGSHDGSRWLGLDRRTFVATACIRQAEILAVAEESAGLRDLLQRAASTLGGDTTAASAIDAIKAFRRDSVGRDTTSSVRPLRLATRALDSARQHDDRTASAHGDYQELVAQADQAAKDLEAAETDLRSSEEAVTRARASSELGELDRVVELADQVEAAGKDGREPGDLDSLREVLAKWSATVAPRALSGPSLGQLDAQIAAVPDAPEVDTDSESLLDSLAARLRDQRALLAADEGAATPPELDHNLDRAVELAKQAAAPAPVSPAQLTAEFERLSRLKSANRRRRRDAGLAKRLAAGAAIGAIIVGLTGALTVAAVLGLAAFVVGSTAVWLTRAIDDGDEDRLAEVKESLAGSQLDVDEHAERVRISERWLADRGLPNDPVRVATIVATRAAERAHLTGRAERRRSLVSTTEATANDLLAALGAAGVAAPDVDTAMTSYQERLAEAAQIAEARVALPQLVELRRARKEAEADHDAQLDGHLAAGQRLMDEVGRHGKPAADIEDATQLAESLIGDQDAIRLHRLGAERMRAELGARLDGRTMAEVRDRRIELAEVLGELGGAVTSGEPARELTEARARRMELGEALAGVSAKLNSVDEASIDAAASSAAVQSAIREVERVEQLGEMLDLTCAYLEAAQAEAYRTVAPQIAAEVNAHLAGLTGGRYSEARVDPEQLTIRVRDTDGVYRDADRLSHGTAEQIHLLLRIAMARTLTAPSESCPLLIDDATVQTDSDRTEAVLSLLLELSAETQIVLFSQEDHVRDWAHANLLGSENRVIELEVA